MAKWRPWRCKECRSTVPPISARGLCTNCAVERMSKSAREMVAGKGPYYENWRQRMRELGERI